MIEEGILQWLSHVEKRERDRISKRVYVGMCAGDSFSGYTREEMD